MHSLKNRSRIPSDHQLHRDPPHGVRAGLDGVAAREDVADPRHVAVTEHVVAPVAAPLIPDTRPVGNI